MKEGRFGSIAQVFSPEEANRYQRVAMEQSRLKIPLFIAADIFPGTDTLMPVPIAMAATWNPDLAQRVYDVEGRDARALGINWIFSPMIDITRDPRWGRIMEGNGEDPFLDASIARAEVLGFQGPKIGTQGHVLACPKHFAGYGFSVGVRDYDEVNISESELWNFVFPPFEAAFKAGAGCTMTAYMALNGVPAAANEWLLTDVLRDKWGFKGFAVSDADNINGLVTQGLAKDPADAAARALNAGEDMESAIFRPAYSNLPMDLKDGKISTKTLDEAVRRVLEMKIRMGLFEHPYVDATKTDAILSDPKDRQIALHAAEESAVLLRNDGGLLPLKNVKSIAVIGPLADSKKDTLCARFSFVKPSMNQDETVTVLEGLRRRAGSDVSVEYAPGVEMPKRKFPGLLGGIASAKSNVPFDSKAELERAVSLARKSDVAVLVLGEPATMIGEAASRDSLGLPGDQQALLEAVVATGKPVVLLLMTARPLDLRWASNHVAAIMDVWYPGVEGGAAVAHLLFGDVNPSGKLPFTWVRDVGQVPMFYDHRLSFQPATESRRYWDEESTPLYPFGFGLTYTSFTFDNFKLDRQTIKQGQEVTLSVDVHNAGKIDASDVVQLYLHQSYGSAVRPARELRGFQKVRIPAGTTETVRFTIGPSQLRYYWSTATKTFVQEASTFNLWVGDNATAALHTTLVVTQ
ncbi:MAG TPA: glycoside hydrolase family 3 N-terminal domain-containing protein [Terracidiphilus sp.]|nr:glycoside hydrolase family 3 N-terminal domain-containing protein [Terracidiphilus sp.]